MPSPPPPPRRAWGTRYDSLVETPISTLPAVPEVSRSLSANINSPNNNGDASATPVARAEKERLNGEHDYPALSNVDASSPIPARMPHDASVFVASLPSNIPEAELQALLLEHLSQHATIKHIKIIRDNRGTVCAFVQVETSAQASDLISACNLSQFMDRHIRCERARAFRTLLVSWRPSPRGTNDTPSHGQNSLEPRPCRLRRCRGSKYIQVTHGNEALSSDPAQLPNYNPPRPDDPLSGAGVVFPEGLKDGDFKSLKSLLEAFGSLEFITPFEAIVQPPVLTPVRPPTSEEAAFMRGGTASESIKDDEDGSAEPQPPHPMWAAKWEHRNDAVSAITALQYIPSLFVCWAHTYGRPHHPPYSQHATGMYTNTQPTQPAYPSTPFESKTMQPSPQTQSTDADADTHGQWAVVPPAAHAGARLQQLHSSIPKVEQQSSQSQTPVAFSESDFPPLGGPGADDGASIAGRGRGRRGAWLGRKSFVHAGAPSPPPISTTLTVPNTPTSALHTPDLESAVEPSPSTSGFPVTPRTSSGGYADEMRKDAMYASAQGYNAPYTPTQGYIPSQPRHGYVVQQSYATLYGSLNHFSGPRPAFEEGQEKTAAHDGRELFIGGLDPETWDEVRVRGVFGQYGTIEDMRFVKPGYHAPVHRRAFAFVKFTDHEAPQRAIMAEHLRIYDDRKIKVQLRDVNPPKRWGYRGRARHHHGLLRADRDRGSLDFDAESSSGEAINGTEDGKEQDISGHVRFASAPEPGSAAADDVVRLNDMAESSPKVKKETSSPGLDMTPHETDSTSSSCSDGAPNASMEVHNHSADTTLVAADMTISPASPPTLSPTHQTLQTEPDSQTVNSTPPPSNPDAASVYASSSTGSVPNGNGYYAQTPSWIPPYAVPHAPYGPYGYYPQQIASQTTADGPNPYPWMAAALYRNVVPFVPWFNPPPGVELAPAPVRPSGYIQREPGGIFIPVYPPERLGQYMSTSGAAVDQSQAQSQGSLSSLPNWQSVPQQTQLYPIPYHMQQAMIMPQQATATGNQAQQQQQMPVNGNGWIAGPLHGAGYSAQHAPSSAPPPYPAPNSYYPPHASATSAGSRAGIYGQYDNTMHQTPMKNSSRRGEHGQQQHRLPGHFGSREGRTPHRRGPPMGVNMNGPVESFSAVDPQWQLKPYPDTLPA